MERTARFSQWLRELPPLRFFGFGFCFAWGYLVWQTPAHVAASFADLGFNPVWLCSAVVSPLVGVVFALIGFRRDIAPTKALAVTAAILTFLGTCLLFCSSLLESAAAYFIVAVLGGLLSGVGCVFGYVLWGALFKGLSISVAETIVPLSFVVTLLCNVLVSLMPLALRCVVVALLPLCAGACLWASVGLMASDRMRPDQLATAERSARSLEKVSARTLAKVCVFLLVARTVTGFLYFAMATWKQGLPAGEALVLTSIGCALAILTEVLIVAYSRPTYFSSFFRWLYVPIMLELAFLSLGGGSLVGAAMVLNDYVFMALTIFFFLYFIKLIQLTDTSAIFLMGIGEAVVYLGALLGGILNGVLGGDAVHGGSLSSGLGLALMVPMCLTVLLLPFDKDSDEGESASSCDPESDFGENEDDVLRRKCQSLAERYGLTNRETEITEYLMQGRSQPYIKDVLHISLSTVGSHARSIYRKLGVHTKQELIDLLSEE